MLPEGGEITGTVVGSKTYIQDAFAEFGTKLPYPSISIEYTSEGFDVGEGQFASPQRVVFAWNIEERVSDLSGWPADVVCIMPMWKDELGSWLPPLALFAVFGADIRIIHRLQNGHSDELLSKDCAQELAAVAELISALSCVNVSTMTIDPPKELNKKRDARGKLPFLSYKVLEIKASRHHSENEPQGGTHASPRVHLRRGHIRRLESGNVWVNACVVGNKALGMVTKDYRVSP